MRGNLLVAALVAGMLGATVGVARGNQPSLTDNGAVERLEATVAGVSGIVQVREDEDKPWKLAAVGMILPVGAECRTGPKSSITLTMPPDQSIVLDRLGSVKILEAFRDRNKLKTDLGMKYGRVRYHIEAAGMEHESVIRSPSSALAVRGTDVTKYWDPFTSSVVLHKGMVESKNKLGRSVVMGSGESDHYGDRPVAIDEQEDLTAAQYATRNSSTPFTLSTALSPEEKQISRDNTVVGFVYKVAPAMSSPQPTPPVQLTETTLKPAGTGLLQFTLVWISGGSSGVVPDLDLSVVTPRGNTKVPEVNDRGGKDRPSGRESITWNGTYPLGTYKYGVKYVGDGDPGLFSIVVSQNGKRLNAPFQDSVHSGDPTVTYNVQVKDAGGTMAKSQGARKNKAALGGPVAARPPASRSLPVARVR